MLGAIAVFSAGLLLGFIIHGFAYSILELWKDLHKDD